MCVGDKSVLRRYNHSRGPCHKSWHHRPQQRHSSTRCGERGSRRGPGRRGRALGGVGIARMVGRLPAPTPGGDGDPLSSGWDIDRGRYRDLGLAAFGGPEAVKAVRFSKGDVRKITAWANLKQGLDP